MNRSTLAAVIVALMLASGIAGYLIGKPGEILDKPPQASRRAGSRRAAATPPARRRPHRRAARRRPRPRAAAPPPRRRPPAARGRARRDLRLSPFRHRQQPARGRGLPCLQQAAGHGRRQVCRLCPHRARGEVGAARGRRQAVHRRPRLRPGLHRAAAGRLARRRRREARRGEERRRGAGRAAGGRHPAGQGLHPAARLGRRPADHHHQRLQGRHRRLSASTSAPSTASPATATTPPIPAPSRSPNLVAALLAERLQRRQAVAAARWRCATCPTSRWSPPSRSATRSRTGSPAPTSSWCGTPPSRRRATSTTTRTSSRPAALAGMWVMDTDIALTTFTGEDGLNVFARSLQSALPLGRPRGRAADARQRADRQGDHRRRRPRDLRRRAAEGPRRGRGLRRHGVGRQPSRNSPGSSSARRPSTCPTAASRAATSPARSTPSSTPSAASIARARPCNSWPCCATTAPWRSPTCR